MEVLGAVASVFTLVEAATKGYEFVKGIPEIQSNYSDLCKEITLIANIIDEANKPKQANQSTLAAGQQDAITQAKTRVEEIVGELKKLQSKCERPTSPQGLSKASKRKWIASRGKIDALLEKARGAHQILGLAMQGETVRAQHELVVQQESMQALQTQLNNRLGEIERQLSLLPHQFQSTVVSIQETLILPQESRIATNVQELDDTEDRSTPNEGSRLVRLLNDRSHQTVATKKPLKLRTTFIAQRKKKCPSECACRCHSKPSKFKTPNWAGQLIGFWEIERQPYQERNLWELRCPCSKQDARTTIEWRPPNWSGVKLFFSMPSYTLRYALRPCRVISDSDSIWAYYEKSAKDTKAAMQNRYIALFPDDGVEFGATFLELIIDWANYDVLELLLREWQNVLPKTGLPKQVGYYAQREMMRTGLGDREISLLQDVLSYIDDGGEPETSPLHEAVRQGSDVEVQQILDTLDKGESEILNMIDLTGFAPLHRAVQRGHDEIVQILITAGADLNCKDSDGDTPLINAAQCKKTECMRLLLNANGNSKCIVNEKNMGGQTALHFATRKGSVDGVRLLLENGALASEKDSWGRTPLHEAAEMSQKIDLFDMEMVVGLLLSAQDVDINQMDFCGRTPLQKATIESNLILLRFLVEKGASTAFINFRQRNLVHLAAAFCNCEILHFLNNLNLSGISTRLIDIDGNTPWDRFVYTMKAPPYLLGSNQRRPNEAEKLAFTSLYRGIRDRNISHDISLLQEASVALSNDHPDRACARFLTLIKSKQKCGEEDWATFYRGIEREIHARNREAPMNAIEEELEELRHALKSDPWDQDSHIYTMWNSSNYDGDDDSEEDDEDAEEEEQEQEQKQEEEEAVILDGKETEGIQNSISQ